MPCASRAGCAGSRRGGTSPRPGGDLRRTGTCARGDVRSTSPSTAAIVPRPCRPRRAGAERLLRSGAGDNPSRRQSRRRADPGSPAAALDDVGDVHVAAREADRGQHRVEQPAGAADERLAPGIFLRARRLSDEHAVGAGPADAEHRVRAGAMQLALAAGAHLRIDRLQYNRCGRPRDAGAGHFEGGIRRLRRGSRHGIGPGSGVRDVRRRRHRCRGDPGPDRYGRETAGLAEMAARRRVQIGIPIAARWARDGCDTPGLRTALPNLNRCRRRAGDRRRPQQPRGARRGACECPTA